MQPSTLDAPLTSAAFQNPTARSRIAPFWFWNGAMPADLVERQVEQMARAGVGGFFIHARQGLKLPYLSKAWFERVKIAVLAAQKWGLEAWLYDEYPYPSGIAGGILTANHPEFRARLLEQSHFDCHGDETVRREFPLGRLVSALACPLTNGAAAWGEAVDIRAEIGVVLTRELFWRWPMAHIPYNEKRFMANEGRLVLEWTAPENARCWRVFVAIEIEQRGFKYYDCLVDPLCPGAAQEFLALTHEGYAASVGEHFGATIPGIFTDEIEPPAWSPHTEAEMRKSGFDLRVLAPALRDDTHPRASEVRYAWRKCGLELFAQNWEKPVADWCKTHDLIWAAEKPTARPAQFGLVAQPSTDAGHRRVGMPPETLGGGDLRANHRAAIAAAEQNGTEEVRCECFHSLGWGATLQDQKWALDWLCVQGVNRFTPHAFYASSSGLAKHDAAPSFFAENPYWPHFHHLGDYAGRLGLAMSAGRERARIALLHPTESQWVKSAQSGAARREYEWLMNHLLGDHHPFHPVDALALARANAKNGGLELGRTRYQTLLVPPLCAVTDETRAAIRVALRAGMRVVMAAPLEEDVAFAGAAEITSWEGVETVENREDWPGKLEKERVLAIRDAAGAELREVWALWRETGGRETGGRETGDQQLLFVCNTAPRATTAHLEIRATPRGWENWSLESGKVAPIQARIGDGVSQITLDLPPFSSVLLVSSERVSSELVSSENASQAVAAPIAAAQTLDTAGQWDFSVDVPNALRLNRWKIAAKSENCAAPTYDDAHWRCVEALPLHFRDQTLQTDIEACPNRGALPVWMRRAIQCEWVPADLQILVENGAIIGDWTLFINGQEVERTAFSPFSLHGDDKIAAGIARYFQIGANTLALRVENAPETGGLRTPLHLIGSFALGEGSALVEGSDGGGFKRILIAPPKTSKFDDLVGAGLPHFSGAALYSRRVKRADLGAVLTLPAGFALVAEVKIDGGSLGARCWSPHEWAVPHDLPADLQLEIRVTNTLLPFIEGQQWDAVAQKPRCV